jgi:hypothetical protein
MKAPLTLLLIHLCLLVNASNYQVHGRLKDAASSQPIEFATIAIRNYESNEIVSSLITDSKGEFLFAIAPGTYKLEIRCLGYVEVIKRLDVENRDTYLNTIRMNIDTKELNEVCVVASNLIEKHDKDIHTMTKQLKEGANTAKDLLTKIRGIHVDPLDNSIRVNNDNNVLLLVDGVEKDQAYIKNLSPDRIIRIEVVNNPTGRYLTDGYSSVINIILKKDFCGYQLFAEENGLYSLDNSNGDDVLFKNSAYVNYTYTYKRFNIYGSYSNVKTNTNLLITKDKWLGNSGLVKESEDGKPNSKADGFSNNFLLGTDIFINSKHSISLETNVIRSPFDRNETNKTYSTTLIGDDGVHDHFVSQLQNNQSSKAAYSLLAYRYNISDRSKLDFDYGFNWIEKEMLNSYWEDNGNPTDQNTEIQQKTSKAEINFKHTFSRKYAVDLGFKNTFRNTNNKQLFLDAAAEGMDIRDIRNALYSYFSYTPKGKLKTKFGLAVEQNSLKVSNRTYNYHSIQPFLNVNYRWSKNLNITLKLNSASVYPYANQVNPFDITVDRITSEKGNQSLSFATNYNTSLDIKLFKNKLSVEPFYNTSENYISQTGSIVNDRFQYTYSNLDRYESVGCNVSTRLTLIPKKMFFNFTGTLYSDNTSFNGYKHRITDFNINSNIMYLSSRYKSLYALMLKRMNSKQIQAYGYYKNDNDYLGFLFKQPFFKKRMALTLLYLLPVSTGLSYSMDEEFEFGAFSENTRTDVSLLKNLFMLKLTFSLNKGNKVNKIKKKDFKEKQPSKGFF